jgi:hypothetical protein
MNLRLLDGILCFAILALARARQPTPSPTSPSIEHPRRFVAVAVVLFFLGLFVFGMCKCHKKVSAEAFGDEVSTSLFSGISDLPNLNFFVRSAIGTVQESGERNGSVQRSDMDDMVNHPSQPNPLCLSLFTC